MYGWYYDGCTVQDEDADVWALIWRAVPEAADDERLHALLVGEMVACSVAELIDEEDVVSMSNDGRLTADEIVTVVSERHGERVYDGRACLDSGEAKPALRRIVQRHRCAEDAAAEIVQWAREHITLDPSVACHGRHPLPIEYVEGEWIFGGTESEPAAVITYATEEGMETGHVGWCWWALGTMGDAPTLDEAKRRAEAVLWRVVDAPSCTAPGQDAAGRGGEPSCYICNGSGYIPDTAADFPCEPCPCTEEARAAASCTAPAGDGGGK